jgi:hypothetical protein
MESLLGSRVRDSAVREGMVVGVSPKWLEVEWTDSGVLTPRTERIAPLSLKARELQVLTLTEGWRPMADTIREAGAAPKSLLEDLQGLLAETQAEPLEEAAKRKKPAAGGRRPGGKSLEKKAREKRRARSSDRKKSGGHNPFKTKTKLGPGPRKGTNTQTHKWRCACATPYKCLCKSGKKRKTVKIKRDYKKGYNHEYKAWRRAQRS